MTQFGFFFDSVSGDRIYTSTAWAQIWAALFPDGVVANSGTGGVGGGTPLNVVANAPTNMTLFVWPGCAFVQGKFFQIDLNTLVTIAAADPTNPRIDRIIIRVDWSARTITLVDKTGTPAVSPSPPTLTQSNGTTWEYSLAQVYVAAGTTAISQSNITSEATYVASNAYMSFGKLKANGVTFSATTPNDTAEIVAGTNIAVSANASTKQITVGVTGTVANATNSAQLGGVAASGYALANSPQEFRAHTNAATALPANTNTKILFPTVDYQTGSAYNTSTSTFTAPSTGTYQLNLQIYLQLPANSGVLLYLYKNGTALPQWSDVKLNNGAASDIDNLRHTEDIHLNAGDTIEIYLNPSSTSGISTQADSTSSGLWQWWSMRKLW